MLFLRKSSDMLGGGDLLICDALVSRDGFGGSYGQGATLPR